MEFECREACQLHIILATQLFQIRCRRENRKFCSNSQFCCAISLLWLRSFVLFVTPFRRFTWFLVFDCDFKNQFWMRFFVSFSLQFVYVNQTFAPAPDQTIKNLYDCYGTNGKLILYYSKSPAWGWNSSAAQLIQPIPYCIKTFYIYNLKWEKKILFNFHSMKNAKILVV